MRALQRTSTAERGSNRWSRISFRLPHHRSIRRRSQRSTRSAIARTDAPRPSEEEASAITKGEIKLIYVDLPFFLPGAPIVDEDEKDLQRQLPPPEFEDEASKEKL